MYSDKYRQKEQVIEYSSISQYYVYLWPGLNRFPITTTYTYIDGVPSHEQTSHISITGPT